MWDVRKKVNSVVIWNIRNSTNEFQKQLGPGCAKHGEEKPGSFFEIKFRCEKFKNKFSFNTFCLQCNDLMLYREQRKLSKKMLINK